MPLSRLDERVLGDTEAERQLSRLRAKLEGQSNVIKHWETEAHVQKNLAKGAVKRAEKAEAELAEMTKERDELLDINKRRVKETGEARSERDKLKGDRERLREALDTADNLIEILRNLDPTIELTQGFGEAIAQIDKALADTE